MKIKILVFILFLLTGCGLNFNIPEMGDEAVVNKEEASPRVYEQSSTTSPALPSNGNIYEAIVRAYPDGLYLRDAPNINGTPLIVMPDNSFVRVWNKLLVGDEEYWWCVSYNGITGYASADYIFVMHTEEQE